ncbi:hypothetical protein E8E14_001755 [Neopestalotiopsis sp. 37M]|nr:hypothetical protein E8E14_001755 [Neopestalotiopsis sp. 37M]
MAANQSRRRVTESADKPESMEQVEEFQYQKLRADVDSLRLLTIEPADNADDAIVCRLEVAEFGEKPEYEALSYMWGSEENQSPIIVNGCSFPVRQNLLEALRYRRSKASKLPLWIDALCINQKDIPERNRQLRIMHHIYFRACRVVIWLGVSYVEHQDLVPRLRARMKGAERTTTENEDNPVTKENEQTVDQNEEKGFVEALSRDNYWQRLWIIQEVAQAENLVVCFGSFSPMQWDEFIHLMTMHNVGEKGPVRLDRLRRNADTGALTFVRLLNDHREADCTERHDKIYGLVGLAADAHGFPMDYKKSRFQVWKDVMHFVNERGLIDGEMLMRFGALIKYLVIGKDRSPLMQVLHPEAIAAHETEPADSKIYRTFKIDGVVLGQIVHIGATTTAAISQLSTVDAWNQKVQENFRSHVEEAQRESRALQRAILRASTSHDCYNHVGSVRWLTSIQNSQNGGYPNWTLSFYIRQVEDHPASIRSGATSTEPSLYQLGPRIYGQNPFTLWRMGIVSYRAQEGDLIVWLRNRRQAIVIIGTAWVTADMGIELDEHTQRVDSLSDETIPIEMDADTMFVMLN